jgi:hypothetical protein
MKSDTRHDYRAAIAVVSGIGNVLKIQRNVNSSLDAVRVVSFEDFLAAVSQCSIAEKKSVSAQLQIPAVVS